MARAHAASGLQGLAMQKFLAILVDGTIYFSWLFIVSIGLTLIYGVMKILNIAHGSFYALGAYTAASAVGASRYSGCTNSAPRVPMRTVPKARTQAPGVNAPAWAWLKWKNRSAAQPAPSVTETDSIRRPG